MTALGKLDSVQFQGILPVITPPLPLDWGEWDVEPDFNSETDCPNGTVWEEEWEEDIKLELEWCNDYVQKRKVNS